MKMYRTGHVGKNTYESNILLRSGRGNEHTFFHPGWSVEELLYVHDKTFPLKRVAKTPAFVFIP